VLTRTLYGNTILDWLIAAAIVFVAAMVLLAVRSRAVRILEKRTDSRHGRRIELALAALEATQPWFLVVVAIFAGAQFVALSPKADRLIDHVALIATIVQAALWASKAVRAWLAHQVAEKRHTDAGAATTVSVLGFFAQLALWSVVILLALENLGFNITALLAGLGVGGIAVALAAQSILGDVFASITIALDRPFSIGDFIVLDDLMGTVEYIGLKTTRLRSLSGEQIVIANSELLKAKLRNFERLHERRVQFTVALALDTPTEKLAKVPAMMREAIEAQPHARFERAHFKEVGNAHLLFEAAYYVSDRDYKSYMDTQQAINLALYARLQQEAIAPVRKPSPEPAAGEAPTSGRQPDERAPKSGATTAHEVVRQPGEAKRTAETERR